MNCITIIITNYQIFCPVPSETTWNWPFYPFISNNMFSESYTSLGNRICSIYDKNIVQQQNLLCAKSHDESLKIKWLQLLIEIKPVITDIAEIWVRASYVSAITTEISDKRNSAKTLLTKVVYSIRKKQRNFWQNSLAKRTFFLALFCVPRVRTDTQIDDFIIRF